MIVEIRGAHFVNKGAELMLLSVINELRNRLPEIIIVVEPQHKIPYNKRVKHHIFAIPRLRKYGINFSYIFQIIPKNLRRLLGIYIEEEVDAIIDVSGFAYGDFWGLDTLKNQLTAHLTRWNKRNIKLVLLPQAFGPFDKKGMDKEFSKVIDYASFIAARDDISYKHVEKIGSKNLYKFPDFTVTLSGEKGTYDNKYEDYIFLIPNSKMLYDEDYIPYLVKISEYLISIDCKIAFLIHEGEGDYEIAKEVCSRLDYEIDIIYQNNALLIKELIKKSKFIISSRFHGLVNGLSQGVPSLSTSWSHKYEMLMSDYDFNEGIVNDLSDISQSKYKIENILNNYDEIKNKIEGKANSHKKQVNKMWDRVFTNLVEK